MRITRNITVMLLSALLSGVLTPALADNAEPPFQTFRQNWSLGNDSSSMAFRPHSFIKSNIIPATMFAVAVSFSDNVRDAGIIREFGANTPNVRMADYMQYAPPAIMGTVKLAGIDGKSDWLRMGVTDVISVGIMFTSVNALKYTIQRKRPDGSSNNSFPSGHTATSFMAATMLHKEYGETVSPWYSVLGYSIAGSVGVARIIENRHWCSDVLAGAGIGTFSTLLAYEISDGLFGDTHLKKRVRHTDGNFPGRWRFNLINGYSYSSVISENSEIPQDFKPSYSMGLDINWMPWYLGPSVSAGVTQMQWTGKNRLFLDDGYKKPDVYWANIGLMAYLPYSEDIGCFARFTAGIQTGGYYQFHMNDGGGTPVSWNIPAGLNMKNALGINIKATEHTSLSAFLGMDWYHDAWKSMTAGTSFTFSL